MSMLIEPLGLTTPISAFNGGVIVSPDMTVVEQKVIPDGVVAPAIALLRARGLVVWVYRGGDWLVLGPGGPPGAQEASTGQFHPTNVGALDGVGGRAEMRGG